MRPDVDDVLRTAHVVCGVVEMRHVVRVNSIIPDIDAGTILVREDDAFGSALRVTETANQMVLKPLTEELKLVVSLARPSRAGSIAGTYL